MLEKTIEIEVLPEELAKEFCNYNDTAQVVFLNEVARLMSNWERPYVFQMQFIIENELLKPETKTFLKSLIEYIEDLC